MKKLVAILIAVFMLASTMCLAIGCRDGVETAGGVIEISIDDQKTKNTGVDGYVRQRQEEFDQLYGDKIKVNHYPSVISNQSNTLQALVNHLIAGDLAYTALSVTAQNYARSLYTMGFTEDVSRYLTEEQLASFDPAVLEACKAGDALAGLPRSIEMPLLAINMRHLAVDSVQEKLFDAGLLEYDGTKQAFLGETANSRLNICVAAVDTLTTWDRFAKFAGCLTGSYEVVAGGNVKNVSGFVPMMTDYYIGYGVWNIANGYEIMEQMDDGKIELDFTNQRTVETVEFLRSLYQPNSETGYTAITANPNLIPNSVFEMIRANEAASFICYPSWSENYNLPSQYLKLINLPIGPSMEEDRQREETDSSFHAQNTNVVFLINYVINKSASEEQKEAVMQYLLFVYGREACINRLEVAANNSVVSFEMPCYTLTEAEKRLAYENIPENWVSAIETAMENMYFVDCNSDAWVTMFSERQADLMTNAAYSSQNTLIQKLQDEEDRIRREWLNSYNANFA